MTTTPVPAGFKVTWSVSALQTFESCPLRYWHEKIAKTVPYVQGEQAKWGDEVHQALETGARDGAPLPPNMVQYQPTLDKVRLLSGIVSQSSGFIEFERQFATTRESTPTGWWDADVFGRCAADVLAVIDGWYGVIIDYKTGKPHNPRFGLDMQPVVNAKMAFDHFPDLQRVDTSFVYMQHNKTSTATFTRSNVNIEFQPVGELLYKLEQAVAHQNFPAQKNGLCRQYCGVTTCVHNGKYPG